MERNWFPSQDGAHQNSFLNNWKVIWSKIYKSWFLILIPSRIFLMENYCSVRMVPRCVMSQLPYPHCVFSKAVVTCTLPKIMTLLLIDVWKASSMSRSKVRCAGAIHGRENLRYIPWCFIFVHSSCESLLSPVYFGSVHIFSGSLVGSSFYNAYFLFSYLDYKNKCLELYWRLITVELKLQ